MTPWHCLFLPSADAPAVATSLRQGLAAIGYTPFDPFGRLPGRAYPRAVRLFVAPARAGWVQVLGEPDARFLPTLAPEPVLWLALDGEAHVRVYAGGREMTFAALAPFLRPGCTVDVLQRSLMPLVSGENPPANDGLPLDALPDDVRALAENVDPKHARSMFARLAGTAARRAGQDAGLADAARQMIAAGGGPDWESSAGRQLRAFTHCLTLPDGWHTLTFADLRDAYPLHLRKQRSPNAALYPGDAEAMARVPDALDYLPIYAGPRE